MVQTFLLYPQPIEQSLEYGLMLSEGFPQCLSSGETS